MHSDKKATATSVFGEVFSGRAWFLEILGKQAELTIIRVNSSRGTLDLACKIARFAWYPKLLDQPARLAG